MKKTIIVLVSLTAVVMACSPKALKTAIGSTEAGGALISSAKCTKCHHDEKGHVPKHTFEEQEKLFINMAAKPKLTWAETQDVMAYVKANAKK